MAIPLSNRCANKTYATGNKLAATKGDLTMKYVCLF